MRVRERGRVHGPGSVKEFVAFKIQGNYAARRWERLLARKECIVNLTLLDRALIFIS